MFLLTVEVVYVLLLPSVLAAPREARALESAQSLIERQKARIEELTETVLLLQQGRGDKEQRLQADLENYVHENQRLRLQLDSLKGEVEALDQLRRRGDKEVQSLVETVAAAEKGIAERDALIRHLQSTDKTAENERLKEEQQRLLHRLNKLQKLAGTTGEGEADGRTPQDLAGDLVRVQRDIELHRGTTRQLGNTIEELRISKMCLVQSEANLLEGQKLIEEQRAEIQRLYKIVEALNREKALVPPVVLTLPKHLRGAGEAQLEALSNKMGLILQALDRERQPDDDREDRTSLALVQQRMFEEQQVILKRQVFMQSHICLHAYTAGGIRATRRAFLGTGGIRETIHEQLECSPSCLRVAVYVSRHPVGIKVGEDAGLLLSEYQTCARMLMQWRTDGSFFYSGTVLHAVIEAEEEEADYREK
ncbi:hypothetical protein EMWEY_00014590 [Eimeria maxima]|uniref:Uncharacterized protein n=1 Tax=Eimeria maxima TaxID=5804 RepID=U6M988_EIMMA|nr:hypothetical protein EMWEY_00014590 [Eimeria maxima]CDJ58245.1 hypothetical protein EMWEY_00014590 [Eimeria maxima]